MLMIHRQDYTIDDQRYTAIANFITNRLVIHRQNGNSMYFSLDEYTRFSGNMEDFIKHQTKE